MNFLILSHFHNIIGPRVFLFVPKMHDLDDKEHVKETFTLPISPYEMKLLEEFVIVLRNEDGAQAQS